MMTEVLVLGELSLYEIIRENFAQLGQQRAVLGPYSTQRDVVNTHTHNVLFCAL